MEPGLVRFLSAGDTESDRDLGAEALGQGATADVRGRSLATRARRHETQ
jgi:hypothetical protein